MGEVKVHAARIDGDGAVSVVGSESALFPWWSFTKTVLAICALRLAEEGRLDLDGLRPGKTFTLRQLLQHRAGVPEYGWRSAYKEAVARGESPWSRTRLLDEVQADRLDFEPGAGWAYSNVGYMFVREAVEEAAGVGLGDALKFYVSGPLGLESVELAVERADFVRVHWPAAKNYDPGWVYHGCLTGTALDAARMLHALFAGKILTAESLRAMVKTYPVGGAISGRPWSYCGYGLGLMSGDVEAVGRVMGHTGAGPFCVNAVYHFPDLAMPMTVATFMEGDHEGPAEFEAVRLAMRAEAG
jgi:D-alanyl-D-alanine carboxypeptidase